MPLVGILDRFDAQEDRCARQRRGQHRGQQLVLFFLGTANAPRHREGAEQQDAGIDRTELGIQKLAATFKDFRPPGAENRVGTEHPAEEQDFRHQEQPHAQLAAVELLLGRVKVVRQVRRVIVITVSVIGMPVTGLFMRVGREPSVGSSH